MIRCPSFCGLGPIRQSYVLSRMGELRAACEKDGPGSGMVGLNASIILDNASEMRWLIG